MDESPPSNAENFPVSLSSAGSKISSIISKVPKTRLRASSGDFLPLCRPIVDSRLVGTRFAL
ncbi:hypothetical protein BDR04DRAFT_1101816 [Suillus decipiens]|nr:hypothetical protein BDR04DRAFT_1101816 [Suillus decipiens]